MPPFQKGNILGRSGNKHPYRFTRELKEAIETSLKLIGDSSDDGRKTGKGKVVAFLQQLWITHPKLYVGMVSKAFLPQVSPPMSAPDKARRNARSLGHEP